MRSVGIDIGSHSIKVVELALTKRGLIVQKYIEKTLGANPAFDPEVEILEFLRDLALAYPHDQVRVVAGLRQDFVAVRNKLFPFSDRSKIQKSLAFELEEDVPFSMESAVFDAKILRLHGPTAEVLTLAAPKSRVSESLNRMQDAGFQLSLLSSEGLAYANCFESWNNSPPVLPALEATEEAKRPAARLSCHISVGHGHTLISVFEDKVLLDTRSILWGSRSVAEAIARRYEIPLVEAYKEMQSKAFILLNKESASYDQVVFSDTIADAFKDLSRDLKISIVEFQTQLNGKVDNVYLTGGGSQVINLHAFLTQQLELPVNRVEVLNNFPFLGFERSPAIDANISIALGLAIEGLKKPRNPPVNFLRGDFAPQNQSIKKILDRWGLALQAAAACFVIFFIYAFIRDELALSLNEQVSDALRSQARSAAKLSPRQATESGVKRYVGEQKRKSKALKDVESLTKMNSAMDILKQITDAVPPKNALKLDVKKLAIAGNIVSIEGLVGSASEVQALQSALASIAKGQIQTGQISPAREPGTAFSFNFEVDRNVSKE